MEPIRSGQFTFFTRNAKSFRQLYAEEEIHDCRVIITPPVQPDQQRVLFDAAIDDLANEELFNEALKVGFIDNEIKITRYELPAKRSGNLLARPANALVMKEAA